MSESEQNRRVVRFGTFELDAGAGELRRQGRLVALTGQPMRVLALLAERPGQVVTRDELRIAIWGEDTHVDFEAGLSTCINQIRSALGDRAASPRFIETLPRRGYRFIAPVTGQQANGETGQQVSESATEPSGTRQHRALYIAAAVLAIVMAVLVLQLSIPRRIDPIPIVVVPVTIDPTRAELSPLSASLTDALIGTLTNEAGSRARVASPLKVKHLRGRDVSLQDLSDLGAEYFVDVALRSLGDSILVHAKLAHISGWILWTSDEPMTIDRLQRDQLAIASVVAKRVAAEILPVGISRRAPRAKAVADYAQANADLDNGRFSESLAGFERALAGDPDHPGALAGLAAARHRLRVMTRSNTLSR
jgi:DNA-binding winged helix-turn-helix (wHTH) protein/TolB-like protein